MVKSRGRERKWYILIYVDIEREKVMNWIFEFYWSWETYK